MLGFIVFLFAEKCANTQYFSECGNNCGKICYEEEIAGCDKMCETGCFCKDGYFYHRENKTCIEAQNCTLRKKLLIPNIYIYI